MNGLIRYTKKGKLITASKIITSQMNHLESATRKIESQAEALDKKPSHNYRNSHKSNLCSYYKRRAMEPSL